MKNQSSKIQHMTQLSLLLALEVVMAFTFLGFVQIPPVSITLMHIPVIIGGILLGEGAGALLGGTFGLLSIIRSTFAAAGPIDIAFNPALSGNPIGSIVMAIVPRVLLGVLAAFVYRMLRDRIKRPVAICTAAVIASLVHSFGVLVLLATLFAAFPLAAVFGIVIGVNGMLELAAAAVIATAVCSAILAAQQRKK